MRASFRLSSVLIFVVCAFVIIGGTPLARAAAEAASEAGTEVTAAMPTGPRGPWALLKRRRRRRVQEPEPTASANATSTPPSPSGV